MKNPTRPQLAGVFPVFQTPWHEDETFDFETLGREIDWLFAQGSDGAVSAIEVSWNQLTHSLEMILAFAVDL